MRWQRNAHRGSRPDGLGPQRSTTHTAESYHAKYKGRASLNFLRRVTRMRKREASK